MAAAGLALTYAEIRRHIGREVGSGRSSSDWGGSSAENTDINDAVKLGLLQAYYPPAFPGEVQHKWSFLRATLAELQLQAAYSTGTVSITTGTVTLTSGTWPSWAADGEIYVNEAWYTVSSRTNGTTIVLNDSSVTVASGSSYTLLKRLYDMPDDFGGFVGKFTPRRDMVGRRELVHVNEGIIRQYDDAQCAVGSPEMFALVSAAPTSAQESKWQAIFHPAPNEAYTLWYQYEVNPPLLEGSSYNYAHGYPWFHQVVLASCLDKATQIFRRSDEKHPAFLEALRGAIQRDLSLTAGQTLGFGATEGSADNEMLRRSFLRRNATITANL